MRPATILSTLAALSALAVPVLAQQHGDDTDAAPSDTPAHHSPSQTPPPNDSSPTTDDHASPSSPPSQSHRTPSLPALSTPSSPSQSSKAPTPARTSPSSHSAASTSTSKSTSSSSTPPVPTLTTPGFSTDDGDLPTGLPTLTGHFGIPTYPPASVPPTGDAPFMRQSSAPDGTVFIAVGAILGAFALALLLWRGIVSLLLHRSVRRAALAQHDANSKAGFPAPPAPFYKYTDHASHHHAPGLAAHSRSARRSSRAPGAPSATPSASNLFFSPTAAGPNTNNPGARGSTFLPSGFYAAGSSTPGGHGHSISMTNLRPESTGHNNASKTSLAQSPPDSPRFPARRDVTTGSMGGRQRAPSAYLDDLLADEPGSLPPPQMPSNYTSPRHSARY